MRNPYIVGRWVRGHHHYGRHRLIDHLLNMPDTAIWMVGTRRMGKTSMLRQMEFLTDVPNSQLVPLFWDLQGCTSPEELADELIFALEEHEHRFAPFGLDVDALDGDDVIKILRAVNRALRIHDRMLFLLIDEAEVLIDIGTQNPKWLARLRKLFQGGAQRTLITSTKLLSKLNENSGEWNTSPFLFGFSLVNLWSLDQDASESLVRQHQFERCQMEIPESIVEEILMHTNSQPYLTQHLCHRLFVETGPDCGTLRSVQPEDLVPDRMVDGFFQIDFGQLTPIERRILLAVVPLTLASEDEIIATLSDVPPERIRTFVYGLNKLGHLRDIQHRWAIGNEFLRNWLQTNYDSLVQQTESTLSDNSFEEMLEVAKESEYSYLTEQIQQLQHRLDGLTHRHQTPGQSPAELNLEIETLTHMIGMAEHERNIIPTTNHTGHRGEYHPENRGSHRRGDYGRGEPYRETHHRDDYHRDDYHRDDYHRDDYHRDGYKQRGYDDHDDYERGRGRRRPSPPPRQSYHDERVRT
ncbi:MAG: AAA family ATPase [Chloroflexota bacterium]